MNEDNKTSKYITYLQKLAYDKSTKFNEIANDWELENGGLNTICIFLQFSVDPACPHKDFFWSIVKREALCFIESYEGKYVFELGGEVYKPKTMDWSNFIVEEFTPPEVDDTPLKGEVLKFYRDKYEQRNSASIAYAKNQFYQFNNFLKKIRQLNFEKTSDLIKEIESQLVENSYSENNYSPR